MLETFNFETDNKMYWWLFSSDTPPPPPDRVSIGDPQSTNVAYYDFTNTEQ